MRNVDCWEAGKFSEIDCPALLPKFACEEEWDREMAKQGYNRSGHLGSGDFPDIIIYSSNLARDMDYPYMVVVDICGEGRLVFMKKWYDLTEFLTKHGGWATNFLLDTILRRLDHMDCYGED